MFLGGVRVSFASNCLKNAASLRTCNLCHTRRLCAGSLPSSKSDAFRRRSTAVGTETGTADTARRRRLDKPSEPLSQRFQPFGRPGGEGQAVATAIFTDPSRDKNLITGDSRSLGTRDAVHWLEKNVVLSRYTAEGMLARDQRIEKLSVDQLNQRLRWFRDRLGLNEEVTRKILVKRPSLLCKSVEGNLEPRARWLQDEFALDDRGVASVVTSVPNVLQSSIEGMTRKVEWLAQRVGLSHAEAVGVVKTCPFVLTNGIDTALEPRLQWIAENLLLGDEDGDELRAWILANPRMIGHGVWSTLAPTMNFLEEVVGLDRETARKFLLRNPLYFSSTSRLHREYAAKQVWFRTSLGMENEEQICKLLRREPRMLGRSHSRLSSLLKFLVEEVGATTEEVKAAAMRDPRLLLSGVETFWVPRVAALRNAGAEVSFKSQSRILLATQKEFNAHVQALVAP